MVTVIDPGVPIVVGGPIVIPVDGVPPLVTTRKLTYGFAAKKPLILTLLLTINGVYIITSLVALLEIVN